MDDILERLRTLWVDRVGTDDDLISVYREAADEIERLRAERDEARREVCWVMQKTGFMRGDYADSRGWDCFKNHVGPCPDEVRTFWSVIENDEKMWADKVEKLRKDIEWHQNENGLLHISNDSLQKQLDKADALFNGALITIGNMTDEHLRTLDERDEARREISMIMAGKGGKSSFASPDALRIAEERGWDCFNKECM